LGVKHRCLGVADRKGKAQKFLKHNYTEAQLGHLFTDNEHFATGMGECKLHKKVCCINPEVADIATGGLPCQPFTKARLKTGMSARSAGASLHPDYHTVMGGFREYLIQRKPRSFFVENVSDMETTIDSKTGYDCLYLFCKMGAALGYAIRVFKLDHLDFIEVPRLRTTRK
jgi:site-specific DNA-cytosine methylase